MSDRPIPPGTQWLQQQALLRHPLVQSNLVHNVAARKGSWQWAIGPAYPMGSPSAHGGDDWLVYASPPDADYFRQWWDQSMPLSKALEAVGRQRADPDIGGE